MNYYYDLVTALDRTFTKPTHPVSHSDMVLKKIPSQGTRSRGPALHYRRLVTLSLAHYGEVTDGIATGLKNVET